MNLGVNVGPGARPSALEQFLIAVGEPLDRPISIVSGNRQHHRGNLVTGFYPEVDTRPIDEAHRYRRPELAHLRADASPWVATPGVSPRPLTALLTGSEGGVTFRPNWVHHENETFVGSKLLFAEWDDLPLEDQERVIADLKARGLGPTAIVFSGSKSLHCYWALEEMLTDSEQWKALMAWLAVALGSDPAIVTLHREMRLPGGYRFKGGEWREQALVEVSPESRYSVSAITALLQQLCPLPYGMDDERFREWKRAKAGQQRANYDGPSPQEILERDFVAYNRQQQQERERQAQERAARREQMSVTGQVDLSDLISQAEDRLGWDAFLPYIQDYDQPHGGKARCLPVFRQGSGSKSAFVSEHQGKILYHDPNSGEKAIGGFRFWLNITRGFGAKPTGKDFVEAAKEFCRIAGIEVPEWKPSPRPMGQQKGETVVPFTRPQKSAEEFTAATLMEWLSRRTFTPSIVINSQYLTEIPMGQSLAIKSGMGTGKTYQIAQLCDKWDGGVILLGSRNGLLLQTKERINEVVQTNLKKLAFIHSDADSWQLRDPHGRVAACVDSLTRFDPESFFGKLVFIDEAQAVLMHLLIGSTVAGRRAVILERFEECLRCAAAIVALDGNLSDRVVEYLEQVSGKTITKLENKHQLTVLDVTLLEPEKARDKSYLQGLAFQALEQGHNIAFVADSQRECEAMDKLCFEQGWKAFRVDSKTMADKEFKKLVQSPTLGHDLAAMGVRCLILSPSAESGLDVSTKGYFSKGFGSFYGVIDTNSQTQILRRVREITDWTVECVEYTQVQTQGPRSSFANTLGRYKLEAVIAELTAAGMAGGDVQVWLDHLKAFTTPHAALSIAFEAGRNYERSATRDCLERALLDQGHRVNRIGCSADEQTKERMKAAKEEIVDRDAAQLMAAESNMTPAEAARKLQSFNCTLDERFQAQRTLLLSRIPGVEHSNLWGLELVRELAFTNKKVLGQLERLWLAQNIDLATNRAQAKVKAALDGKTFMADLVPYLARLQYLISLGLLALIGDGEWYTSESEVIKSAYERAKRSRKAKVLGLAPASGDTPIKWVSRLLKNLFGVTSESLQTDNGRNYKYGLPVHADLLPFVAIHMQKSFAENCIADWPQTPTQPSVEAQHTAPIDLTHGETVGTEPVSEPPSNDLPILNFGGFDWYVGTIQGQESVCWVGNDPSVLANWWPFEATFEKYSAA